MMQFKRRFQLIAGRTADEGVDLSQLHCVFSVNKSDNQQPNTATVRVDNITRDLANQVKTEFDTLVIEAGYEENYGIIFKGNIVSAVYGHDATETYIEINGGDGDEAYNFGFISQTLIAGATSPRNQVEACQRFANLPSGYTEGLDNQTTLSRGKVMFGMTRSVIRTNAKTLDCAWSIQNGALQFIKRKAPGTGRVVSLTSDSGLVGSPAWTDEGISATCLLNPQLQIGHIVNIPSDIEGDAEFFRIIQLSHAGDTRGNDWYTTFSGVALDATQQKSLG